MSPEANAALLRIKADYPTVQWAQDMPNTVILWFDHIKAFVHLVGEEMDPPIELDEGRARSALDALLGVTVAAPDEMPEPANDFAPLPDPSATAPTPPVEDAPQPAPEGEPPAPQSPTEF